MSKVGAAQCVIAVVLILVAAHVREWRVGTVGTFPLSAQVRMGLTSMEACSGIVGACQSISFSELTSGSTVDGADRMFLLSSAATYFASWIVPMLLIVGLVSRWRFGLTNMAKLAATGCGVLLLSAIMTAGSWSGEGDLSLGWAFYLSLAGGGVGLMGCAYLIMPVESYTPDDLAAVLLRRPQPVEYALAQAAVSAHPRPLQAPPGPTGGGDPTRRDPLRNAVDVDRRSTAVDTAATMLRFVASECTIGPDGLHVRAGHGGVDTVGWDEMTTLMVRKLPPDPPFEGKLFLDVLTQRDDARVPLRFMATTRANYAALPGGAGRTSMDNFRRLSRLILDRNRNVTFAADFGQFLDGGNPRRFNSIKEFRGYDSRFG